VFNSLTCKDGFVNVGMKMEAQNTAQQVFFFKLGDSVTTTYGKTSAGLWRCNV
jgi:hypothetical protein